MAADTALNDLLFRETTSTGKPVLEKWLYLPVAGRAVHPDQHLGEAEAAPLELSAAEASSAAVQRALALHDWTVQNGVFIDRARLAEVLGARWSMLAQEGSVAATDSELHAHILQLFPLLWLRAWISPQKLEAGPTRSFVRQLIWTDLGHLTLLEVMVAAVALFDTDEAAQKALVPSMSTFISKKQCATAEHLQVA